MNKFPLLSAVQHNDLAQLQNLVEQASSEDANAFAKDAYRAGLMAVNDQNVEGLTILLPILLPRHVNDLLCLCVELQDTTLVHVLLPYADPTHENSSPLQLASALGNTYLLDLLYPLSNPKKALRSMQKNARPGRTDQWKMLEERIQTEAVQKKLERATHAANKKAPKSSQGRKL